MQRWSTLTVVCFSILAAVLGFYGGKFSTGGQVKTASTNDSKSGDPSIIMAQNTPVETDDPNSKPQQVGSLEDIFHRLLAMPATPARDDELIAALEKLAEQNPMRAIELAQSEMNQRRRRQLLAAAFLGWGKTDAKAAAAWILAQPEDGLNHNAAIAAVLKGAVQNPDAAIQLTQWLDQQNPEQSREYGDALIYALGQNGNYQRAADFAAAAGGNVRTELLSAAYGNWANYQPQNAAASAMGISDADARQSALDAVIAGWGQIDPKGLADFTMSNLSDGSQKTHALSDALVLLAGDNVADAANWISQFSPAPEFDQGEAAIATQQDVMKQPDVALGWAQVITDPNLRSRTLVAIIETWSLSDPSAALNFSRTSTDLLPEDRANVFSNLSPQSN